MSAKITIVIGDYTYGGNDIISAGQVLSFRQDKLKEDREATMSILSKNLLNAVKELEANEKINPKPQDEPCCQHWVDFAAKTDISKMRVCPLCATPITKERRDKFSKSELPF